MGAHPIVTRPLNEKSSFPKQVVILKEEPLRADADFAGVPGGVPGGIPGGQLGGVIGGILGGIPTSAARGPAPPAEKVRAPIRVGGRLRAPRAIYRLAPDYPPLARQARIQGDVTIDAVIDKAGSVVEMKVVSGPPLLIPAALAAARAWKFEPTYLNDEAIDVQFILTVHFQLQD
jgi:protein TonB